MSFTPPALPWLRLLSYCYIVPATSPLLTMNQAHKQNWIFTKWRQRIWRSKTSHYSSRSFSSGVCPDSDHQTRREIAWGWLHLFFFHAEEEGKKWREKRGKTEKGVKLGRASAGSRAERDPQQRCCGGALQEMKLHLEQGEEEIMWRWVRCGAAGRWQSHWSWAEVEWGWSHTVSPSFPWDRQS